MVTTVTKIVAVTVWKILHVTYRLVNVTRDVTRDILMVTVAKVNHIKCAK